MLRYLRENVGNWFIKAFLAIIILVFVFFGFGSFGNKKADSVASVNDESISFKEYQQSYQNLTNMYESMFGRNLDEKLLKAFNIKQQALDQLITRKILMSEAEKFNIKVSDQEIQDSIAAVQAFQSNSSFDIKKYKAILSSQSMTAEEFENLQRAALQQEKLKSLIYSTINVSDMEARQWYEFQGTKAAVNYIEFEPASYKKIKPEEAQIKQYYDENKEQYKTLPERKVLYIKISPENFKDSVKITDDNIKAYYEQNIEEFSVSAKEKSEELTTQPLAKVSEKIRQILEKKEMADTAYFKAFDAFDSLMDGDDFEQAALLAGTKIMETGFFKPNGEGLDIKEKQEVVDISFALTQDTADISDVKQIGDSYYIIKLVEVREPKILDLKQARDKITQVLTKKLRMNKAREDAEHYLEMVIKEGKPEKIAKTNKLKIEETQLFLRNGNIVGIKNPSPIIKAAFTLTKDRNIYKEVIETGAAFFIISLKERQIPAQDEIAENLKNIKKQLTLTKQRLYFEEWVSELKKQYEITYNPQFLN